MGRGNVYFAVCFTLIMLFGSLNVLAAENSDFTGCCILGSTYSNTASFAECSNMDEYYFVDSTSCSQPSDTYDTIKVHSAQSDSLTAIVAYGDKGCCINGLSSDYTNDMIFGDCVKKYDEYKFLKNEVCCKIGDEGCHNEKRFHNQHDTVGMKNEKHLTSGEEGDSDKGIHITSLTTSPNIFAPIVPELDYDSNIDVTITLENRNSNNPGYDCRIFSVEYDPSNNNVYYGGVSHGVKDSLIYLKHKTITKNDLYDGTYDYVRGGSKETYTVSLPIASIVSSKHRYGDETKGYDIDDLTFGAYCYRRSDKVGGKIYYDATPGVKGSFLLDYKMDDLSDCIKVKSGDVQTTEQGNTIVKYCQNLFPAETSTPPENNNGGSNSVDRRDHPYNSQSECETSKMGDVLGSREEEAAYAYCKDNYDYPGKQSSTYDEWRSGFYTNEADCIAGLKEKYQCSTTTLKYNICYDVVTEECLRYDKVPVYDTSSDYVCGPNTCGSKTVGNICYWGQCTDDKKTCYAGEGFDTSCKSNGLNNCGLPCRNSAGELIDPTTDNSGSETGDNSGTTPGDNTVAVDLLGDNLGIGSEAPVVETPRELETVLIGENTAEEVELATVGYIINKKLYKLEGHTITEVEVGQTVTSITGKTYVMSDNGPIQYDTITEDEYDSGIDVIITEGITEKAKGKVVNGATYFKDGNTIARLPIGWSSIKGEYDGVDDYYMYAHLKGTPVYNYGTFQTFEGFADKLITDAYDVFGNKYTAYILNDKTYVSISDSATSSNGIIELPDFWTVQTSNGIYKKYSPSKKVDSHAPEMPDLTTGYRTYTSAGGATAKKLDAIEVTIANKKFVYLLHTESFIVPLEPNFEYLSEDGNIYKILVKEIPVEEVTEEVTAITDELVVVVTTENANYCGYCSGPVGNSDYRIGAGTSCDESIDGIDDEGRTASHTAVGDLCDQEKYRSVNMLGITQDDISYLKFKAYVDSGATENTVTIEGKVDFVTPPATVTPPTTTNAYTEILRQFENNVYVIDGNVIALNGATIKVLADGEKATSAEDKREYIKTDKGGSYIAKNIDFTSGIAAEAYNLAGEKIDARVIDSRTYIKVGDNVIRLPMGWEVTDGDGIYFMYAHEQSEEVLDAEIFNGELQEGFDAIDSYGNREYETFIVKGKTHIKSHSGYFRLPDLWLSQRMSDEAIWLKVSENEALHMGGTEGTDKFLIPNKLSDYISNQANFRTYAYDQNHNPYDAIYMPTYNNGEGSSGRAFYFDTDKGHQLKPVPVGWVFIDKSGNQYTVNEEGIRKTLDSTSDLYQDNQMLGILKRVVINPVVQTTFDVRYVCNADYQSYTKYQFEYEGLNLKITDSEHKCVKGSADSLSCCIYDIADYAQLREIYMCDSDTSSKYYINDVRVFKNGLETLNGIREADCNTDKDSDGNSFGLSLGLRCCKKAAGELKFETRETCVQGHYKEEGIDVTKNEVLYKKGWFKCGTDTENEPACCEQHTFEVDYLPAYNCNDAKDKFELRNYFFGSKSDGTNEYYVKMIGDMACDKEGITAPSCCK